jgi:hypothetical protein
MVVDLAFNKGLDQTPRQRCAEFETARHANKSQMSVSSSIPLLVLTTKNIKIRKVPSKISLNASIKVEMASKQVSFNSVPMPSSSTNLMMPKALSTLPLITWEGPQALPELIKP